MRIIQCCLIQFHQVQIGIYQNNRFHIGCLSYASDSRTAGLIGSAVSLPALVLVTLLTIGISLVCVIREQQHKCNPQMMKPAPAYPPTRQPDTTRQEANRLARAFNSNRPFSVTRPHHYETDIHSLNTITTNTFNSFDGYVASIVNDYSRDIGEL